MLSDSFCVVCEICAFNFIFSDFNALSFCLGSCLRLLISSIFLCSSPVSIMTFCTAPADSFCVEEIPALCCSCFSTLNSAKTLAKFSSPLKIWLNIRLSAL